MVWDPPAVRPAVEDVPARSTRLSVWVGVLAVLLGGAVTAGIVLRARASPRGPVVMTLEARTAGDLPKAAGMLRARLAGAGYDHPRVTVTGDRAISVSVGAGADADGLRLLAQPGRLSFRAVVAGPATPYLSASAPAGTPSVPAAVVAKLGTAYPAARAIADPGQVDPALLATLAAFGTLTPEEVATLPGAMQYAVPAITCAQLDGRPAGAIDDPAATVTACERTSDRNRYLLAPATVTAADVAGAHVELRAVPGWTVTISFTATGQPKWTALTRAAVGHQPSNQVAIVLDNQVLSAPAIQEVLPGDAVISGGLGRDTAARLAALLRSGPLPVAFTVTGIHR
jgi:preprotein translocase subunit SecD